MPLPIRITSRMNHRTPAALVNASIAPRTELRHWRWLAGLAYAALSVTIFAGWFVVTRFTVTHQLRIWDVTALRFGGGAILLLPVLLKNRLPAKAWAEGLLFAALWGAPFVLLVATGLRLTTAAQASAVVPALMPVFAGMIGWAIYRKFPGWIPIAGYVAIAGGLNVLVFSHSPSTDPASPTGFGALILAAGTWAVYSVRFRNSGLTALQSAALICFWSAVFFLPIYLVFGLSRLGNASGQEVLFQLVYQGVLMSGVALFAYNSAISLLGAGAAAAMMALVPVIAAVLAIPILGEIPSFLDGIAVSIMAIGVMLAARSTSHRLNSFPTCPEAPTP